MKGSTGGRDRALHITGGEQLAGKICVSGSKNAALPEMAAALLTTEPVTLQNVPRVTDTVVMGEIISLLGGHTSGDGTVVIDAGAAAGGAGPPRPRPPPPAPLVPPRGPPPPRRPPKAPP